MRDRTVAVRVPPEDVLLALGLTLLVLALSVYATRFPGELLGHPYPTIGGVLAGYAALATIAAGVVRRA